MKIPLALAFLGLIALKGAWSQSVLLPTGNPFPAFFFKGIKDNGPVPWANSCLVVLRRTAAPLRIKATRMGQGTVDMKCSVLASSRADGPKSLVVRLGMEGPPDDSVGEPWSAGRGEMQERELPVSSCYLALVTKPKGVEWKKFEGPVVPRMIIVSEANFRPAEGSGMQRTLASLFRAVATAPAGQAPQLSRWLYDLWHTQAVPLIEKWKPGFPTDTRLAALSDDSLDKETDKAIGSAAITEARKAGPSERSYLTLLGAIWGADAGFGPFFDSCTDPKAKPDLGVLMGMVESPSFAVLPVRQAIDIARRAGKMAGIIMRMASMEGTLSEQDRKDMFLLTSTMARPQDRREVYRVMCKDLPIDLTKSYPDGLLPPYKSDGSIPNEPAYRAMWQRQLGLPVTDLPPP